MEKPGWPSQVPRFLFLLTVIDSQLPDTQYYVTDPAFGHIPVDELLSEVSHQFLQVGLMLDFLTDVME